MSKPVMRKSRFVTVLERDVDLLLLEELCASPEFRTWLADEVGLETSGQFTNAFHSMRDDENRETDLLVLFDHAGLLVENKISAEFQPDQVAAYAGRARKWKTKLGLRTVLTVLTAPKAFIAEHPDARQFNRCVPYERIHGWFFDQRDSLRAQHRAALLKWCLHQADTGPADKDIRLAWDTCMSQLRRNGIDLHPRSSRPPKGTWFYFRFQGLPTSVFLRYRLRDNWVELSFQDRFASGARVEKWFREHPLAGAHLHRRGRTETAVWLPTPELPLGAPRSSLESPIRGALRKADDLRRWWLRVSAAPGIRRGA